MKRLVTAFLAAMLLVGALAGLGVFSPDHGGAESDDVPVLQTQVADLDARVTELEGGAVRWQWVGIGPKSIDIGVIPAGTYRVTVSYPSVTDGNWMQVAVQGSKSERVHYWVAAGDPPVAVETTFIVEASDTFGMFVSATEAREAWVIILTSVE